MRCCKSNIINDKRKERVVKTIAVVGIAGIRGKDKTVARVAIEDVNKN